MNHQNFTENGNQKFPLSTQALAFMQEQIKLAYGLTDLAGQNIIVREPTVSVPGLVIYDGELLPLTGTRPALLGYIVIAESTETISVEGRYEGNVRTTRVASYAQTVRVGGSQQRKLISAFTTLKSISTLMAELDDAKQHHVPTGAIMMWSGAIANIPTGWALCNGQNGTPDLRGRFIVSATYGDDITFDGEDYNYPIGTTGGKNEVKLTVGQMPKHNHDTSSSVSDGSVTSSSDGDHTHKVSSFLDNGSTGWRHDFEYGTCNENQGQVTPANDNMIVLTGSGNHSHTVSMKARGNGDAHENRPVFYALAYIMKVI